MSTTHSTTPTIGAETEELLPLLSAVAMYGPPVLLLAVPWFLLGVLLSAPFTLALALMALPTGAFALLAALVSFVRRVLT